MAMLQQINYLLSANQKIPIISEMVILICLPSVAGL